MLSRAGLKLPSRRSRLSFPKLWDYRLWPQSLIFLPSCQSPDLLCRRPATVLFACILKASPRLVRQTAGVQYK